MSFENYFLELLQLFYENRIARSLACIIFGKSTLREKYVLSEPWKPGALANGTAASLLYQLQKTIKSEEIVQKLEKN